MVYMLRVRHKIALLQALLGHWRGATLSLEGDLSLGAQELSQLPGVSRLEQPPLVRNTLEPPGDFVVIPLDETVVDYVGRVLLPRIGLARRAWHVLIAQESELMFAAYDCFDPDGTWVSSRISESFLRDLVVRGVLKDFRQSVVVPTATSLDN